MVFQPGNRYIFELGNAQDSVSLFSISTAIQDNGNAIDSLYSGLIPNSSRLIQGGIGNIWMGNVPENGNSQDSTFSGNITQSSIIENGSATDVTTKIAHFLGPVIENGNVSDVMNAYGSIFLGNVVETGNLQDHPTTYQNVFVGNVLENGNSQDTVSTL